MRAMGPARSHTPNRSLPLTPTYIPNIQPPTTLWARASAPLGDLLAAHALVEQHQGVGAKGQSMRHRSIARQCDQSGTFLSRQKAGENHSPTLPLARVFLRSQ